MSRGIFVKIRYVRACDVSEIPAGKMKKIQVDGIDVLITNLNGKFYAVSSECTHFGGDLSEGILNGNVVVCPNHKARFDVTTGNVVSPPKEALSRPDIENLSTYLVKVKNQKIMIKISQ